MKMCKSDNKENPVISSTLPSANIVEHELKHSNTNVSDLSKEMDQHLFVDAEVAALKPAVSSSSPVIQQQQSRGRRGQSYHPRRSFQYSRAGYRGMNRDRRFLPPIVTQPDPGKTACLLTEDGRSPEINISQSASNDVRRDPRSRNNQNIPRNGSTAQKSQTDVQKVQATDVPKVQTSDVPKVQANEVKSSDNHMSQNGMKENEQRRNEFPPGRESSRRNDRNSRFHYNQSNFPRPPAGIQQNRTFTDVNKPARTDGNRSVSQSTTQEQEDKPAVTKPNVFGEAIPVDTYVKWMEIEQKKLKEKEERNKMSDASKKASDTSGEYESKTIEKVVVNQPSKTFARAVSTNVLSVDAPSAVNLSETSSIPPKLSITTTTSTNSFKNRNQKPYIQSNPQQMFYLPQHYQQIPHHIQPGGVQVPAQHYGQFAHPQFQPAPQVYYQPQQLRQLPPQQLSTTYPAYPQLPYQHVPNQQGASSQQYIPQVHQQYGPQAHQQYDPQVHQQYGPQVHQQHGQQYGQLPPMQYSNGQTVYYVPSYDPNAPSNYGQTK